MTSLLFKIIPTTLHLEIQIILVVYLSARNVCCYKKVISQSVDSKLQNNCVLIYIASC